MPENPCPSSVASSSSPGVTTMGVKSRGSSPRPLNWPNGSLSLPLHFHFPAKTRLAQFEESLLHPTRGPTKFPLAQLGMVSASVWTNKFQCQATLHQYDSPYCHCVDEDSGVHLQGRPQQTISRLQSTHDITLALQEPRVPRMTYSGTDKPNHLPGKGLQGRGPERAPPETALAATPKLSQVLAS